MVAARGKECEILTTISVGVVLDDELKELVTNGWLTAMMRVGAAVAADAVSVVTANLVHLSDDGSRFQADGQF